MTDINPNINDLEESVKNLNALVNKHELQIPARQQRDIQKHLAQILGGLQLSGADVDALSADVRSIGEKVRGLIAGAPLRAFIFGEQAKEARDALNIGDLVWFQKVPHTVTKLGKGEKEPRVGITRYDGYESWQKPDLLKRRDDADEADWEQGTVPWIAVGDTVRGWFRDEHSRHEFLMDFLGSSEILARLVTDAIARIRVRSSLPSHELTELIATETVRLLGAKKVPGTILRHVTQRPTETMEECLAKAVEIEVSSRLRDAGVTVGNRISSRKD